MRDKELTCEVRKPSAIGELIDSCCGDDVEDHPLYMDNSSWPEAVAQEIREKEAQYLPQCA